MQRTNLKVRDPKIEIYRFVASLVIFFHHSDLVGTRLSNGGWIFVEFFLMLTGYYTARHFDVENSEIDPCVEKRALFYTLRKATKIIPFAAVGITVSMLYKICSGEIAISLNGEVFSELILHFLMLKCNQFIHYDLCNPLWYISAVLMVLPVLTITLVKRKDFVKYIGCWLVPIMCYNILYLWHGNVQYWYENYQLHCVIRVIAGLNLGFLIFYLSEYLKQKKVPDVFEKYLFLLGTPLFLLLAIMSFPLSFLDTQVAYILWMTVPLIINFSGFSGTYKITSQKFAYLGKLSVPIYCIHLPVQEMTEWLAGTLPFVWKVTISLTVTLALSVGLTAIFDKTKSSLSLP